MSKYYVWELGLRKQTRVYLKKSWLACPATRSWENSICTHYILCLTNFERTLPPALGLNFTSWMLRSVNPYLFPSLGICAHQAEARIGSRTIFFSPEFDWNGAAFSILEFLCFASRKYHSYLGSKFFWSWTCWREPIKTIVVMQRKW